MTISTVHGRVLDRPGSLKNGIQCLQTKSIGTATGIDFNTSLYVGRFTGFTIRWNSLYAATQINGSTQVRFGTDGASINSGNNYGYITDHWRSTSSVSAISGNDAQTSLLLDSQATDLYLSGTATVRGISGEFSWMNGGASEDTWVDWVIAGKLTATGFHSSRGSGRFLLGGGAQNFRLTFTGNGNAANGSFELWGYKVGIPGE